MGRSLRSMIDEVSGLVVGADKMFHGALNWKRIHLASDLNTFSTRGCAAHVVGLSSTGVPSYLGHRVFSFRILKRGTS
jgi:hypothetical protein